MIDKKEVFILRKEGLSQQKIADRFGVSRQRIEQILNNRKALDRGLREYILTLRHHKCVRCDKHYDDSQLEIHHLDFNTNNNDILNLYVVCVDCHKEYHRLQKNNLCPNCKDNTYKISPSRQYGKLCIKCYQEKCKEAAIKRKELLKKGATKCIVCGNTKVFNFTHSLCYKCYAHKRYDDNKEKHKKLCYKWKLENPEQSRKIQLKAVKKWQEANKDKVKQKAKERYYKNHEKNKERQRAYYNSKKASKLTENNKIPSCG